MTLLSDLLPDLNDPEAVAKSLALLAASPLRHPTSPEKLEEIRDRLQLCGEYRVFETAIQCSVEDGWKVVHGSYVKLVEDLDRAHRMLLHYQERLCTSCGGKGCSHDLSGGRKTFLVDPLPDSALTYPAGLPPSK
jgi:hypothetical protein